ncbi:LruC domain-containing protein [Pseudoalteromonas spongiae]|uniref:LruC domain-containing protein n=1 Tax=Pseudoalteromonas spongiae TaxID=298657 RepID=UPI00110A38C5|nr:LruC domain-containing protein [Pseudoalteromonas spongiae]TMO88461.1 LruC domain-containing protein [Pseudoalteromonas spongiae]
MKSSIVSLLFIAAGSSAAPFDTCPSKAFLVQGTTATIFGVNLVSGSYNRFADNVGTNQKVNGFGFSVHDRYLYGWDYSRGNIGRIGKDYALEPLNASGLPNTNFYVGDVSVQQNAYYVYRKGADYGLYRIVLDENDSDYLVASKVIDGSSLNLNIFDLAFHPDENLAYSVDNRGNLIAINVTTGSSFNLGFTGVTGTFGAVYFDVEGYLYISRNSDGHIFRIDINDSTSTTLFAYGPSSGNNDGARCATAPIIDESEAPTLDYGDAPDSYATSISANGARHGKGNLYFGNGVSAEHTPNQVDDDDGVNFVTGLETGLDTLVSYRLSAPGYVNAWVDWNGNGQFDESEQIITEHLGTVGENRVLVEVPIDAREGTTWARFRVSNTPSISPLGGVDSGEVEDISVSIVASGVVETTTAWQTAAFEDLWPQQGDYDFNDVVVKYRIFKSQIGNQVVRLKIDGELLAVGASYHNAFAFRFANIARNQVDEPLVRLTINGQQIAKNPLEAGRNEAILIALDDTKVIANTQSGCKYFRTESGCLNQQPIPFSVTLPFKNTVTDSASLISGVSPFIFAVNGFDHGPFVDSNNARAWEVHLKNHTPTEAFNTDYFDQGDDMSSTYGNFQTANGLPWALIIGTSWNHPKESTDMLLAYPEFGGFAESAGSANTNWFRSAVGQHSVQN